MLYAMGIIRGRAPRIALWVAGGIVVMLGVAQLVLPSIAAQVVRSRASKYGTVKSVSVTAFPAIELLWGSADSASLRAGSLRMSLAQSTELLLSASGVDRIDMSAENLQLGSLRMHEARMEKRGDALYTQGSLEQSDLRAMLPGGVEVQPVAGGVEVRASGTLFGVSTSVRALVSVQEGKLVAQPQGFPFAGLARITLLSDPHLLIQGFELSSETSSTGESGYRVKVWARLR
jgi:hypothetical protein